MTATIELLSDVPDPKTRGVRSGYRPHHKFPKIDWLASGVQQYPDDELHYPGETLVARITFASWEWMRDKLRTGDTFEIRELDRVVGRGTIDTIP